MARSRRASQLLPSKPREQRFRISFPFKGISDNLAFGDQEPQTTRDAKNVRNINPKNGRIMGAQRAGLSRYYTNQISGTNKIYDLATVTFDSKNLTYVKLENEVSQPEAFDNSYWTKSAGAIVLTNNTNAPDGSLTADLVRDTNGGLAGVYRDFDLNALGGFTNGDMLFFSIYTRGNSNSSSPNQGFLEVRHLGTNTNRHQLRFTGDANPPTIEFRSNSGNAWRAVTTNDPVYREDAGSLYYRFGVGVTWNSSLTNTLRAEFQPVRNSSADTGSAWAWGAQFELGTCPGPYTYFDSATTPNQGFCVNVQSDRQGNLYALDDEGTIIKYSANLKELFKIPLPVQDKNHVVRALHVDEFDCIYAAVSEGGDQSTARIWKYVQEPDNNFSLLWSIESGFYTEELKTFKDRLYCAQNSDTDKKSRIIVYEDIATPEPVESWRTGDVPVPHPVRGMDVNSTGDVMIACDEPVGTPSGNEYRLTRGVTGGSDIFYPSAIDATVAEIINPDDDSQTGGSPFGFAPQLKIWARYSADSIVTNDVDGDLEEGVEVLKWRDISGNGRDLEADPDNAGPTLSLNGPAGRPTLRFNGSNQALRSGLNGGSARANRDQQVTCLPGYTGSQWVFAAHARPNAGSNQGCMLEQKNTAISTNVYQFGFWANRNEGSNTSNPVYGQFSVYDDTTNSLFNASGTDAHPASASFTNAENNVTLFVYVNNNDASAGSASLYSAFRLNGTTVENGYSSPNFATSNARTYVGRDEAGSFFYAGDISEIVVLAGAETANQWVVDAGSESDTDVYPIADTSWNTNGLTTGGHGVEQLEGQLAHKYGSYGVLPSAVNTNGHTYGLDSNSLVTGPPSVVTNFGGTIEPNSAVGQTYLKYPLLAKFGSANGTFKWVVNENTAGATGSSAGGVGYGVVVGVDDHVLSIGPDASATNATNAVRKVIDNGDTVTVNSNGAWTADWSGNFPEYKTPRLATDQSNNLYVPVHNSSLGNSVRIYDGDDGTQLYGFPLPEQVEAHAIAVNPLIPDYDSGDSVNGVAEFIYVGTENNNDITAAAIHKVPLVKAEGSSGAPRDRRHLAVANNSIIRFSSSGTTTIAGGSGSINPTTQYVQSAILFQKVYFADGFTYRIFDPIENKVTQLESCGPGSLPQRAKLIESWRGRLVLARAPDDPHNWYMSKKDDPTDWDLFPPVPSPTQAVAGNTAEAGLFPDIVNTMVPYSDDVLFFGGDREIWAMSGDPAAGGRLDLISDITGMAFGRPWAKDPDGVLYFYGSRGGLYRMVPGRIPQRLSMNRIERRLQDSVNLSTHYIRLVYNYRDEGIHIFQCPFGAGGTSVKAWFYDIKTDSFWEDQFGTSSVTAIQPTSVLVIDGDEQTDRFLLLGGEDGYARKWDESAKRDDQTQSGSAVAIDSFFTAGPLDPMVEGYDTEFSGLTVVLGDSEGGCRYELFAGEEPDSIGVAKRSGSLVPGRNSPKWDRVTGSYCWVRLRNAAANQRFSLERAYIHATVAGIIRPRS